MRHGLIHRSNERIKNCDAKRIRLCTRATICESPTGERSRELRRGEEREKKRKREKNATLHSERRRV